MSTTTSYPDRDPQLMYELATNRLATQLDFIDAIDSKIAMLVSLASALLGIAAAVFALNVNSPTLGAVEIATLAVGGALYLIVVGFGMNAYFACDWDIGPQLNAVWEKHESEITDNAIKWGVANDCLYAFEENERMYGLKQRALFWVFAATVLETLVLVLAIALVAEA